MDGRGGRPLARSLAEFAAGLRYDDLPEEVVRAVELHVADGVGVGMAGAGQPFARPVLRVVDESGGHPQATVWATGARTSAAMAALANGTVMHGLDFDDTHTVAIVHATAAIAPAVLAVAEWRGRSGAEAVTAAVAGYEALIRIGLAAPGAFHAAGFHATAICGAFGAAVAAGKLLSLDERGIANALAIAGSQAAGLHEFSIDYGSWMKRFHAGWAAHAGVLAAQMAAAGFTGPETVLEGRFGLYATHLGPEGWDAAAVVDGLGERWETSNLAFKPYPSCHFTHSFIDAARELRADVAAERIEWIRCDVAPGMAEFICDPWEAKLHPDGEYAAKFSLPYCVATMLLWGEVTLADFTDEAIARPQALALMRRATYRPDPESVYPQGFPGTVTIGTIDGATHRAAVDSSRGTPGSPFTEADVRAKFAANLEFGGVGERTDALWEALAGLRSRTSAGL